ncbi:aspartic peptidase domain-containing protein [Plectosphaerella plurivora]|uniref:Aspartic peptidase domain-containing protein n=1 Tax=Plectosphaerella plurivora TaxID=936078 RepID=A0A9P8VC25_9PEZI|nr:aspartic peptidase domain-containing protein [Plectosphaerella plurivora]
MAFLVLLVAVLVGLAAARPSAVALTPSTQWYGIDGNWSTIAFDLGEPAQAVNVLVSTALSEFWVVQAGGCLDREPLCGNSRGNVFTPASSTSWKSIGTWSLGLAYLGYGGNGDYGLDAVSATTLLDQTFSMSDVLTAAVNATQYYIGFLGLGITQGNFAGVVHESPLTQAVQTYGRIPSYSYGYTAGAYYMGSTGVPCSLTLGGYDENRFIPHNTRFTLANNGNTPQVLVRGISVSAPEDGRPPVGWSSTTRQLSNMTTRFEAIFAAALGLTYNSTFDLYTINNTQFDDLLGSSFSFTFSLSSFDNSDDFSNNPLSVPGVVNITITAAAFAQVLRYPFRDGVIPYGAPSVPYFPLRRTNSTDNSTASFIIGRAFLQEAYMIVRYDSGVFSLHESLYPEQSLTDLAIVDIDQPDNSPYPPPAGDNDVPQGSKSLGTGQIVGIVVGVIAAVLVVLAAWFCYRRRKQARKNASGHNAKEGSSSSIHSGDASTPMAKLMSRMVGRSRSKRVQVHEAPGSVAQPTEVGAEAGHAVYELPAPMGPTELDASNDTSSITGDTELGTDNSHTMSAYEAARLKLAKELQGPVPPYSPPENPADHPVLMEKGSYEVSPITTLRPSDGHPSPLSSPTSGENSNSFPGSLPSPMSQRDDSMIRTLKPHITSQIPQSTRLGKNRATLGRFPENAYRPF